MTNTHRSPLLDAIQKRVDERLSPVTEIVERVRAALDPFMDEEQARIEREIHDQVLAAIGQGPTVISVDEASIATLALRSSLLALLDLLPALSALAVPPVEETPPTVDRIEETSPETPPSTFAQLLAAEDTPRPSLPIEAPPPSLLPSLSSVQRHAPTRAEVDRSDALIKEFDAVDEHEHGLRLHPLLQAIVADTRDVMAHIHLDAPVYRRLERLMQRIDLFRVRLPAEIGFVKGLSPTYHDDWSRVSREARKRLARFDADAQVAAGVASSRNRNGHGQKSGEKRDDAKDGPTSHEWPALPSMRARMESGGLYLVGGLRREEKIALMQERFGVEAGWFSVDNGSSKDIRGVVQRVKKGRIAAILFLEGLTSHNAWLEVQAACKATSTPFAMADKGGVASIAEALDEIERQLVQEGA